MNKFRRLKEITKDSTRKHSNRIGYVIALAGFLALVGLFASLADEVREGDTIGFDRAVLVFIRSHLASPQLDSIMVALTNIGGVVAITIITILVLLFMWKQRMYSRAVVFLLGIGGIALAVTFLKLLFARARPTDVGAIINESSFSFPSGHSMGSMGLAVLITLLFWPTKWRVLVLSISILYVLIVGFSRMYLGVHYPTDVAAGWLLGAGWVGLVYTIFKSNKRFKI